MTDVDHKGRRFTRDSEAQARYDTKTVRPAEGGSLGAAAAANKSRPKAPKRADFSDEAGYAKAYKSYRDAMTGDSDMQAQKKALGMMK
jgi:hypothetical protein